MNRLTWFPASHQHKKPGIGKQLECKAKKNHPPVYMQVGIVSYHSLGSSTYLSDTRELNNHMTRNAKSSCIKQNRIKQYNTAI